MTDQPESTAGTALPARGTSVLVAAMAVALALPTSAVVTGSGPAHAAAKAPAPAAALPMIVGGQKAPIGSWPDIVAIKDKGRSAASSAFCGGTLIHKSWVVTAAHCLQGVRASSIELVVGRTKLKSNSGETIAAAKLVRHRWNKRNDKNDIALIKLARPAAAPPLQVVGKRAKWAYRANTKALVAGWGGTRANGRGAPNHLREARLEIISTRNCRRTWRPLFAGKQVCAGIWPEGGVDTCGGDSGGPLVVTKKGRRYLAGVTSFGGNRCGTRKEPAVYTKAGAYKKWAKRVIRRG